MGLAPGVACCRNLSAGIADVNRLDILLPGSLLRSKSHCSCALLVRGAISVLSCTGGGDRMQSAIET